jgi:O-antigen ligase
MGLKLSSGWTFSTEKIYSISLIGLLFCIPLLEAPKSLFSLITLGCAVVLLFKQKQSLNLYQKLMAIWIFIALLSSLNASVQYGYSGSGFLDILRFCGVGFAVSLLGFGVIKRDVAVLTALLGTTVAAAIAVYKVQVGDSNSISLKSVGHVNHSAIYLQLVFCLGAAYCAFSNSCLYLRVIAGVMTLILCITLLLTESRAAIAAMVIVAGGIWLLALVLKRWAVVVTMACVAALSLVVFSDNVNTVTAKHEHWSQTYIEGKEYADTPRGLLNQMSFFTFTQYPVLGIGIANYGDFSKIELKESMLRAENFKPEFESMLGLHPHNMYLDYLATSGLLGMLPFMFFWVLLIVMLFGHRPLLNSPEQRIDLFIWSAGAGVLVSNLAIGFFNNPLHHENASLSLILLSLVIYSCNQSKGESR